MPLAHRRTSLSPIDNQYSFSDIFNKTGSLIIPPSLLIIRTYLHWPTFILDKSRGVKYWINFDASGPLI